MEKLLSKPDIKNIEEILNSLNKNMPAYEYLSYLSSLIENPCNLFIEKYKPIIDCIQEEPFDAPFITIIMRTQGKRPQAFRESLLCLSAQEDQNFEVIIISHKATEKNWKLVETIIHEQEPCFKEKIRLYKLDEGNRSTPLNFGLAHSRTEYIAVLDDDDIVLANWIKEFHSAAKKYHGNMLRAYAFRQEWYLLPNGGERSVGPCIPEYCKPYNMFMQLDHNEVPLMSIAFPSFVFKKWGIMFDETLNTTEDWDFSVRVAQLCGVRDIKKATSIYRIWLNAESSETLYSQQEWRINYLKVINKRNQVPSVLPINASNRLVNIIQKAEQFVPDMIAKIPQVFGKLYFSNKFNGFSEDLAVYSDNTACLPQFDVEFNMPELHDCDKYLRFDPCNEGQFVIDSFSIIVTHKDGSISYISHKNVQHNGYNFNSKLLFLKTDPQIIWENPQKQAIDTIRIVGTLSSIITDEMIDKVILHEINSYKQRPIRAIGKVLKCRT